MIAIQLSFFFSSSKLSYTSVRLAVLGVTPIGDHHTFLGNALLSLLSITLFNTVMGSLCLLPFPTSVLEAHLQVEL